MNERHVWSIDEIIQGKNKVLGEKMFQCNFIHVSHVNHNSQVYVQYANRDEMSWNFYHSSVSLACYACYTVT